MKTFLCESSAYSLLSLSCANHILKWWKTTSRKVGPETYFLSCTKKLVLILKLLCKKKYKTFQRFILLRTFSLSTAKKLTTQKKLWKKAERVPSCCSRSEVISQKIIKSPKMHRLFLWSFFFLLENFTLRPFYKKSNLIFA